MATPIGTIGNPEFKTDRAMIGKCFRYKRIDLDDDPTECFYGYACIREAEDGLGYWVLSFGLGWHGEITVEPIKIWGSVPNDWLEITPQEFAEGWARLAMQFSQQGLRVMQIVHHKKDFGVGVIDTQAA